MNVLRIDVADHHAQRPAGRDALEPSADDLDAIGLQAGRIEFALARAAFVQLFLDFRHVDLNARRYAIDDAEQPPAVAGLFRRRVPTVRFATSRDLKNPSKCVA